MKKHIFLELIALLTLATVNLASLEIPLDTLATGKETAILAYVDMDRILSVCQQSPEVQQKIANLRATYVKEEKELEEKIASIEKEITVLAEEISVLTSSAAVLANATTAVLNLPGVSEDHSQEIESKQKELTDKKSELENIRQELERKKVAHQSELEKQESQICNEKIVRVYEILKKVAAEEEIAIIVNKGNILYGPPHRDLTEKVLREMGYQ